MRWSALFGLGLILAVLIPLTALLRLLTGASLHAAEWAKAEFARLWGAK